MSPSAVVQFEAAGFGYPNRPPVLSGLTLSVEPGEIVVLVGRSGAGKSTILKLVNRLILPTSGTVRVEGRDTREWDGIRSAAPHRLRAAGRRAVSAHDRRRKRRPGAAPGAMGGRSHLARARTRCSSWSACRRQRSRHAGPRSCPAANASGSAWPGRSPSIPPILLMDEPFGALDPVTRVELQREFLRIQRQLGTTVILVTHDMSEAFALAHRIGVLDAGQLVVCDTPEARRPIARSARHRAARHAGPPAPTARHERAAAFLADAPDRARAADRTARRAGR